MRSAWCGRAAGSARSQRSCGRSSARPRCRRSRSRRRCRAGHRPSRRCRRRRGRRRCRRSRRWSRRASTRVSVAGDDLADVAVAVEAGVDPVARRTRLLAAGHLAAFPVDHGELLLLAGREGEAVEQVAHRVAVGHPLLLEPQHVAVRDRRGLVDGQVVVPEDRVLAGEPTPAGLARDRAAEEPVQVRVQRQPGGAGDASRW